MCRGEQGWGPLHPSRSSFTPCFLDGVNVVLSVWGLVAGILLAARLLRNKVDKWRPSKPEPRIYIRMLAPAGAAVVAAAQGVLKQDRPDGIQFQEWIGCASLLLLTATRPLDHCQPCLARGMVLVYWVGGLTWSSMELHLYISKDSFPDAISALLIAKVTLLGLQLLLELFPRPATPRQNEACPIESADMFSYLTFSWVLPMLKYGNRHYITTGDLWELQTRDQAEECLNDFLPTWQAESRSRREPSLWMALTRAFGPMYFRGALLKLAADCLGLLQPQLLRQFLFFAEQYQVGANPESQPRPLPPVVGAAIAIAMFAVSVGATVCLHQYYQRTFETGMRVKAGLTAAIYKKGLRLSNGGISEGTGTIVNHMAVDVQLLQNLCQHGQQIWSAPFQIAMCLLSLYHLVGSSVFAGISAMLCALLFGVAISRKTKVLQKTKMENSDARIRLIAEILDNVKAIKLYAWTWAFQRKLAGARGIELRTLRKIGVLRAGIVFTWSAAPSLLSTSIFAAFVLTQRSPLSTNIGFPALALFNMLTLALAVFPQTITAWIDANVAVRRLVKFLTAPELQPDAIERWPVGPDDEHSVTVRAATLAWGKDSNIALQDIDFCARVGELSCIIGRVASGKSSLLGAMLGELHKVKGEVVVRGTTAFVAQNPWLMNCSIRKNIVFGNRWDPDLYEQVVRACALESDLRSLAHGDHTIVGERGISLSGGQRARVALARAVFSRCDVYILDDVLSAVDQHVGNHIMQHVLGDSGLLGRKTRILATNCLGQVRNAQYVTLMSEGRIVEQGTPHELMSSQSELARALKSCSESVSETQIDTRSVEVATQHSPEEAHNAAALVINEENDDEDENGASSVLTPCTTESIDWAKKWLDRSTHLDSSSISSSSSTCSTWNDCLPDVERDATGWTGPSEEQLQDLSTRGEVKWETYLAYAGAGGWGAASIYVVVMVFSQLALFSESLWLKHWSKANEDHGENRDIAMYLGIYSVFGVASALLALCQTLMLWTVCAIKASKNLHETLESALFRVPMSFFEKTLAGSVLNRFSGDMQRVDEVLAETFNILFVNVMRAIVTLATISCVTPGFISLIIPLAIIYQRIQKYYRRTSRELKRLHGASRGPIFAHFRESLAGASTIRAYGHTARFARDNQRQMDTNSRAYFASISANRWLGVRLEFLGSLVILSATSFMLMGAVRHYISPSFIGLALNGALSITQSLNLIVRQTVAVENNIVSAERVLEYAKLPREGLPDQATPPPASWPSEGAITFDGFSTRYDGEASDLVLKDISLSIKAHEKIGVVGRTGAGKSSLVAALFRLIEASHGSISIDGLVTSSVGLHNLRSKLGIIPQDSALFAASVRENLDPHGSLDDTALWAALDRTGMQGYIAALPGGLDSQIREGGANFSSGQRQLLSVARALLTTSNILILDEATASVDLETDAMLQAVFRGPEFNHRTVITIAHRINTVLDSDRIIVLEAGRVKEFDTPAALIRSKGLFYELVASAGMLATVSPE